MSKLIANVYKERVLGRLPTVALEQQVEAINDCRTLDANIQNVTKELESGSRLAGSLEDLAIVVDQIREITPQEAALIQLGGDMAVAGTDQDADTITPSMESMLGASLTGAAVAKKVKDTIQKIVKAILEMVKRGAEYVRDYATRVIVVAGGSETRLKKLQQAFDAAKSDNVDFSKRQTISMVLPVIGSKNVTSGAELISETKKYITVLDNFITSAGEANHELGSGMTDLYDSEGKSESAFYVNKLATISKAFSRDMTSGIRGGRVSKQANSVVEITSADLIGGIRLIGKHIDETVFTSDSLTSSTAVRELLGRVARSSRISVDVSDRRTHSGTDIIALDANEIKQALDLVKTLIQYYSTSVSARSLPSAMRKRSDFAKTCNDRIVSQVKRIDEDSKMGYALASEALAVTNALMSNSASPYAAIMENTNRVISYLLTLISKSIHAHAKSTD